MNQLFSGDKKERKFNNYVSNTVLPTASEFHSNAAAFENVAYQSLSESLQIALGQIEQLNKTVKMMNEKVNNVQREKN